MDKEKLTILRGYFNWLNDEEFFKYFNIIDGNTCIVKNEKFEILSLFDWENKYNTEWCYDYESTLINGYVISIK